MFSDKGVKGTDVNQACNSIIENGLLKKIGNPELPENDCWENEEKETQKQVFMQLYSGNIERTRNSVEDIN